MPDTRSTANATPYTRGSTPYSLTHDVRAPMSWSVEAIRDLALEGNVNE
jgi:hypothetical protein